MAVKDNTLIRFSRCSEIAENRQSALIHLSEDFTHVVGQPVIISYYTDETKTDIDTIVAIGIKNGIGKDSFRVITTGQFELITDIVYNNLPDVSMLVHGEVYLYDEQTEIIDERGFPIIIDNWYSVFAERLAEEENAEFIKRVVPIDNKPRFYIRLTDNTLWVSGTDRKVRPLTDIYTRQEVDDIIERLKEETDVKILEELLKRVHKLETETIPEDELIVSQALNTLKQEIDEKGYDEEKELIISSALNDLNNRVGGNEAKLNYLSEKVSIDEKLTTNALDRHEKIIIENEKITSEALNSTNDRLNVQENIISEVSEAMEETKTIVNDLSSQISSINDKVDNLDEQVNEVRTDLGETKTEVNNLKGRVDNVEEEYETINQTVDELNNTVNNLDQRVTEVEEESLVVSQALNELKIEIDDNAQVTSEAINDLNNRVDGEEAITKSLSERVTIDEEQTQTAFKNVNQTIIANEKVTSQAINSINDRIEVLDSTVGEIRNQVNEVRTDLGETKTEVTDLKGRVDNVEESCQNISQTVDELNNTVTNLDQRVTDIEEDSLVISQALNELKIEVDDNAQVTSEAINDLRDGLDGTEASLSHLKNKVNVNEELTKEKFNQYEKIIIEDEKVTAQALNELKNEIEEIKPQLQQINYYEQDVTTGSSVTILRTVHKCGKYPSLTVYRGNTVAYADATVNEVGDIVIRWTEEPDTVTPIRIVLIGKEVFE